MKLHLSQNDIKAMVSETVNRLRNRSLLSEITAVDAYNRFYLGKIPEYLYKLAMSGTTNMTPFHKILLDYLVMPESDYKEKYRIYSLNKNNLAKEASTLWNKVGEEGRQYLVKSCNEDVDLKKHLEYFCRLLRQVAQMKSYSEKQYRGRGLEVLYEDDNLRITCTKSYSASAHFYGKSHWCTASDQFGDYDGFEMFKDYTAGCWNGDGILIQFVMRSKEDTYQIQYQVRDDGSITEGQCCDWEDNGSESRDISDSLSKYGLDYREIYEKYIVPNAVRLSTETYNTVMEEAIYYNRKKMLRLRAIFNGFDEGITCKTADEFARKVFANTNDIRLESEDGLYTGWRMRQNDGFTQISIRYNGKNQSEKETLQRYWDDCDGNFEDRYGRLPNNYSVYIFDSDGNIFKKWRGEISNYINRLMFITVGYNEELSDVRIAAIVDIRTYKEVAVNPFNHVTLEDTYYVIDRNIDKFLEALNDESSETIEAENIDSRDWFIYQPTREYFSEDKYVAINSETLEQITFVAR